MTQLDGDVNNYFRANFIDLQNAISVQKMKKFTSLENNVDRMNFLLQYPEVYELPLEIVPEMRKNRDKALEVKDIGNKLFSRGQFVEALACYSNAVLLAPEKELSVILANRAATLYHLEKHKHALIDAEEAVRIGYPKELFYKLEEKRARCWLVLNEYEKAVTAFKNALKALDDSKLSLEKKQKLEADIRVMLAVMEKGNQLAQKTSKNVQRTKSSNSKKENLKIQECNPLYPFCSKSVEIQDDGGEIGRHAVATKDIKPGEILAIEKPHCAFLLAEYRIAHCHYCLTKIFVPIPASCMECSCVAYCSVSCRNAEEEIHKHECKILPSLWLSNTSINCFLALRTIIQQPFEKLFELRDKLGTSKEKSDDSVQTPRRSNDYETFYGLVTHAEKRTAEDLLHRTYIAIWLLRLLKNSSYFPDHVKTSDKAETTFSDGELFIGGLILHNLMVLQFNSHEISTLFVSKGDKSLSKAKSKFIGGGVYPTVALFNHSCNPGIIRYFNGTTMIVRAIRSISAGEEISENYGPIFTTTQETERKRKLRWQYWFDCNCEACSAHWPLLDEIDTTILRFKCETGKECGNILPVRLDADEFVTRCPKCGRNTNILMGLKVLQDTDAIFKTASRNLAEGKHEVALKSYLEILKLLDGTLALPIRDYHLCQESVRLCMLSLGNISYI